MFQQTQGADGGLGSQRSRTRVQFIIHVTALYSEGLLGRKSVGRALLAIVSNPGIHTFIMD